MTMQIFQSADERALADQEYYDSVGTPEWIEEQKDRARRSVAFGDALMAGDGLWLVATIFLGNLLLLAWIF